MATFWDLPLEIRTQIYHLLIDWEQYFCFGSGISVSRPKIHKIDPSILRVNKRLSDDAGSIFYRDNLVELWVEVDYDKRDTIDIMLDAALVALTDKEAGPRSWKCRITIHVSYGNKESEFYEGRLIMYKEQAKFPSLSGAAHAKEISRRLEVVVLWWELAHQAFLCLPLQIEENWNISANGRPPD